MDESKPPEQPEKKQSTPARRGIFGFEEETKRKRPDSNSHRFEQFYCSRYDQEMGNSLIVEGQEGKKREANGRHVGAIQSRESNNRYRQYKEESRQQKTVEPSKRKEKVAMINEKRTNEPYLDFLSQSMVHPSVYYPGASHKVPMDPSLQSSKKTHKIYTDSPTLKR
jgi:hypothetical protein